MLDKVEIRVPGQTPFRPEFQWIEKEIPYAGQCSSIRRSVHYQGGVDLRLFGWMRCCTRISDAYCAALINSNYSVPAGRASRKWRSVGGLIY
jgi:hypothetical protein